MSETNIIEKVIFPAFVVTATIGTYPIYSESKDYSLKDYKYNSYSKLFSEQQPQYNRYIDNQDFFNFEKINTILTFANNLLSNSVELKKEVSEMVDENFWDLI